MASLKEWLTKYDLGVAGHRAWYVETLYDTVAVWCGFEIKLTTHARSMEKFFSSGKCFSCDRELEAHRVRCSNRNCQRLQTCQICAMSGSPLIVDGIAAICTACAGKCGGCGNGCDPNFSKCSTCAPRFRCEGCLVFIEDGQPIEVPFVERDDNNNVTRTIRTYKFCPTCAEHSCGNCGQFVGAARVARRANVLRYAAQIDANACAACYARYFDEFAGASEEFVDDDGTADSMVIPTCNGRAHIRDVGIEIEGGGDGRQLATHLYAAGHVPHGRIGEYHSGTDGYTAVITRDASVDWEMVIGKFNPSDKAAVKKVHDVLKATRTKVKDGTCKLDLRCGCHIHVDAHKVSITNAYNLWAIWNYLEDAIFRIGASHWSTHRSVRYGEENGAAVPMDKTPHKSRVEFGTAVANWGRYGALSFQNFWNAFRNCVCGAYRYEAWNECTCNLGKCTFEFRVFNSTLNPRKLHAYVALSQAMVAKAIELPQVNIDQFPPLEWNSKPAKSMTPDEIEGRIPDWKTRLSYIFKELPLTQDEKESIAYCVRNSDLKVVGDIFIDDAVARPSRFQAVAA